MKVDFAAMGLMAVLTGAAAQSDIVVTTTTESIGDDDIPMTYDDDGISSPPDESPAPVAADPAFETMMPASPAPVEPGATPGPAVATPSPALAEGDTPSPRAQDTTAPTLAEMPEEGVEDDDVPVGENADPSGAAGAWPARGGVLAFVAGAVGAAALLLF